MKVRLDILKKISRDTRVSGTWGRMRGPSVLSFARVGVDANITAAGIVSSECKPNRRAEYGYLLTRKK